MFVAAVRPNPLVVALAVEQSETAMRALSLVDREARDDR